MFLLQGGECLIYPGFNELYLFLREKGISASIKTNGVLLDEDRISFFEKYPPRNITVSLYGSNEQSYKKVTGNQVFEIVYNNLLRLKGTNLPINLAITPSEYMIEDFEGILD